MVLCDVGEFANGVGPAPQVLDDGSRTRSIIVEPESLPRTGFYLDLLFECEDASDLGLEAMLCGEVLPNAGIVL